MISLLLYLRTQDLTGEHRVSFCSRWLCKSQEAAHPKSLPQLSCLRTAPPPPPDSKRHDHLTKPAKLKWEKSPHRAQANRSHHARVSVRGQTGPAAAVTTPDAGNRWPVERPAPAELNLIDRQTEPDTDTSLRLAAKIVGHNSTTADPVFHLLFPYTLCIQACISLSVYSRHIHTPIHWVISAQSQTSSHRHRHTHTPVPCMICRLVQY